MDTASTIIGLVLLLLFIGPVTYAIMQQANKEKKRLKHLREISAKHNINLDHVELDNTLLLGLDEKAKKLIIVQPQNGLEYDIVDLSRVSNSVLSQIGSSGISADREKQQISRISLSLLNGKPNEKLSEIIFYDEKDNSNLDAEVGFYNASKWDRLLKKNLAL